MSENTGIEDEDLPQDLQPSDDNPLAQDLDEDERSDDLEVLEGKDPEQSGDDSGD